MGLNEQKGNMYPWVTHTFNTVKGKCPHNCSYCYMNVYPLKQVRFDATELKTDLGMNNIIFVGSSCDMWAESIPSEWIQRTLEHCQKYRFNTYLFQSKNPKRFFDFIDAFPAWFRDIIFATTLETNRDYQCSLAPKPSERVPWMWEFTDRKYNHFKRMLSIEPIMDFDLIEFSMDIRNIHPDFVSIGADSKGHKLIEPSKEKTLELIKSLEIFTGVKKKDNLKRILEG